MNKRLILAGLTAGIFCTCLLTTTAWAQQPPNAQPPAKGPAAGTATADADANVTITPKEGGWSVEELFRIIAKYTGKSIVYDPKSTLIQNKKIEFVGPQTVPKKELFEWFQSLLSFSRLILVPIGPEGHEQYMALDLSSPQITNRPVFVKEDDLDQWADRDGVYIVSTITVKNLTDTSRARNALAQLSTRSIGRINDVPGNLAFVVADFAPVVVSMYRLLKAMDKQPIEYNPVAETYPLKNALADEVEPILSDLLQAQQGPGQQRGSPSGAPQKPEPRIIADNRQDAIIVYGVPEDQKKIADLINLLDQEVHYKQGNIRVFPLKNTNATDMANTLTELVRGTGVGTTPTAPNRRGRSRGGVPSSAGSLGGSTTEPVIVADSRTNSLIIQASTAQMSDLRDIISQLDTPRDQVLVEAALVELTIDDEVSFGTELTATSTLRNNPNISTGFGRSAFGLSTLQDTNNDGIPDINIPNFSTAGLTAGIFSNSRFPLIMQTLANNSAARALSIPSVVVEDGKEAKIDVSDEVYYQNRTIQTGGETNFSASPATAEISLDISPHISSDNFLRLHIEQNVGSFGAQADPTLPPPQTKRSLSTDVVIPDGYTVVMGGLIDQKKSNSDQGIPYLKDIPLLGYLFGTKDQKTSTTSLFLFVTPHILKSGTQGSFDDYQKISWKKKLRADELLGQTVDIIGAHFKGQEMHWGDTLDQIQDTGILDHPTYETPPQPNTTQSELEKRMKELQQEQELEKEKKK